MLVVIATVTIVLAANAQTAPQECGANMRSVECREKVARTAQSSFNRLLPNLSVRTMGDVIVLADPKAFAKQEDRRSFYGIARAEGMEAQLCEFGFTKMRIESANASPDAKVGESYELRCPNFEEPPKAKTAIPTETLSVSRGAPGTVTPCESTYVCAPDSAQQELQPQAGLIIGKIFAITKGGDLKPARLAMVFLLDEHAGGHGGRDSAAVFYLNTKIENMKASYRQLVNPDDNISCQASLLVFYNSLKRTLEWNQNEKRDQIKIGERGICLTQVAAICSVRGWRKSTPGI